MKVLMIEHFLPFNTYTKELSEYLCKQVDLTVLTKRNYDDDSHINWTVKSCLNIADSKNKLYTAYTIISGWLHIISELLFGGYDIVHVQTFKNAKIEMLIYKTFTRGPLVHTVHNLLPHEADGNEKELFAKFYQSCQMLITHNNYCKTLLINEYGICDDQICVMPHGIYGIGEIHEKLERKKTYNILQFGSIRGYKGIDILISAISLLDKEYRDKIHVTIVGKQYKKLDSTDYYTMINDFDLGDVISFRPERIDDEELSMIMKETDICIFPYRNIYGSGALLMAYAFGKPVIASGIPTFIEETDNGKTGLLFRSEDAESLKDTIQAFVDLPLEEKQRYVDAIKDLVSKKYNWEKSSTLLFEAYLNCLE